MSRPDAGNISRHVLALIGLGLLVTGCGPVTAQGPAGDAPPSVDGPSAAGPGDSAPADAAEHLGDDATEWPRWRGPRGDGVANGARLPDPWPAKAPPALWTTPAADGWSSPIVAEGHVLVTEREAGVERLRALDFETGREAWRVENPVDFDPHPVGRRHGNGPKSTPAAARGRVFALGIAGWLVAVDIATGREAWHVDLPAKFGRREALPDGRAYVVGEDFVVVPVGGGQGAPVPLFGYTGSLLTTDKHVVLSVGGAKGGTVMAFDQQSGAVAWKALDENVSYSSPIRARLAGIDQIVVMTGPRVVGLAVDDGRLLWEHPFQIQYDESIGTPVVAGDLVMFTATGRPLTAVRIAAGADGRLTKSPAWTNRDLSSYLSSMQVAGGHVFGMNDGGEFACVELASGRTVWIDGSHGYYTTPVLAGRRIVSLNEEGALSVLAADPAAYRPLAEIRLADEATWTTPAVVGSRLVVRSARNVACFDFARP